MALRGSSLLRGALPVDAAHRHCLPSLWRTARTALVVLHVGFQQRCGRSMSKLLQCIGVRGATELRTCLSPAGGQAHVAAMKGREPLPAHTCASSMQEGRPAKVAHSVEGAVLGLPAEALFSGVSAAIVPVYGMLAFLPTARPVRALPAAPAVPVATSLATKRCLHRRRGPFCSASLSYSAVWAPHTSWRLQPGCREAWQPHSHHLCRRRFLRSML